MIPAALERREVELALAGVERIGVEPTALMGVWRALKILGLPRRAAGLTKDGEKSFEESS